VTKQVVLGSERQVETALAEAVQSQTINTSFVERYHGTQRQLVVTPFPFRRKP